MLKLDGITLRSTQVAHGPRVVVSVGAKEAPQLDRREVEQLVEWLEAWLDGERR